MSAGNITAYSTPCPIPPRAVDAVAALSSDAAVLRSQLAYTLRALRGLVDAIDRYQPGINTGPMAIARSALEQFEAWP